MTCEYKMAKISRNLIVHIFILATILPLTVYCLEEECQEIRIELEHLYNSPIGSVIDQARAQIKSKLEPADGAEHSLQCKKDLSESAAAAERCVKILSDTAIDPDSLKGCEPIFDDQPILDYAVRGIVVDNETFATTLINSETYLKPLQKSQMYLALVKEILRTDLDTLKRLFETMSSKFTSEETQGIDKEFLKQCMNILSGTAFLNRIDGAYHPSFLLEVQNITDRNSDLNVRNCILDIVLLEAEIGPESDITLNDIAGPILALHDLAPHIVDEPPFDMLINSTIAILKRSPHFDTLDEGTRKKIDDIYGHINKFYIQLYTNGEFCVVLDDPKRQYFSGSSWENTVFLRNKGTFKDPDFAWYKWTEKTDGDLLLLKNFFNTLILPNDEYDVSGSKYEGMTKTAGTFKEDETDICSRRFRDTTKILSGPFNFLMKKPSRKTYTYGGSMADLLPTEFFKKHKECPEP